MANFSIETHELKRCVLVTLHGRIDSSKAPTVEAKVTGDDRRRSLPLRGRHE